MYLLHLLVWFGHLCKVIIRPPRRNLELAQPGEGFQDSCLCLPIAGERTAPAVTAHHTKTVTTPALSPHQPCHCTGPLSPRVRHPTLLTQTACTSRLTLGSSKRCLDLYQHFVHSHCCWKQFKCQYNISIYILHIHIYFISSYRFFYAGI